MSRTAFEGILFDSFADHPCGRHRLRTGAVGHYEKKFLAPKPAENVIGAHSVLHQFCQKRQQSIPGKVAVGVVVDLEVVEVEHENRHLVASRASLVQRQPEAAQERTLVENLGQLVDLSLDLLLAIGLNILPGQGTDTGDHLEHIALALVMPVRSGNR